jgi:Cys-rich protein (TIGR01571 family)
MGDWQQGLFSCFNNCGLCVITYFLPCITAGRNAEAVGKSCVLWGCLTLCGPIGIFTRAHVRSLLRDQKGIEGSFIMDILLHWFCACCSLIQEAQEIEGGGGAMAQSMARC